MSKSVFLTMLILQRVRDYFARLKAVRKEVGIIFLLNKKDHHVALKEVWGGGDGDSDQNTILSIVRNVRNN